MLGVGKYIGYNIVSSRCDDGVYYGKKLCGCYFGQFGVVDIDDDERKVEICCDGYGGVDLLQGLC